MGQSETTNKYTLFIIATIPGSEASICNNFKASDAGGFSCSKKVTNWSMYHISNHSSMKITIQWNILFLKYI